jgi:hypothetical protein
MPRGSGLNQPLVGYVPQSSPGDSCRIFAAAFKRYNLSITRAASTRSIRQISTGIGIVIKADMPINWGGRGTGFAFVRRNNEDFYENQNWNCNGDAPG